MILREYKKVDADEMAAIFINTVHNINSADYSPEEINAWTHINREIWHKRYSESYTIIAEENNIIIGFGNIYSNGYLDMLYVHKDHQHMGVAATICSMLECHFKINEITVHSSITARPFFEKRGYMTLYRQTVVKDGVSIINYVMKKTLL